MGFSLYNLFKAGLLITNGVAILHPKRFLAKVGYSYYDNNELNSSDSNPLKAQIVGLLQAVAYLKGKVNFFYMNNNIF